jgi:hypothetical protein
VASAIALVRRPAKQIASHLDTSERNDLPYVSNFWPPSQSLARRRSVSSLLRYRRRPKLGRTQTLGSEVTRNLRPPYSFGNTNSHPISIKFGSAMRPLLASQISGQRRFLRAGLGRWRRGCLLNSRCGRFGRRRPLVLWRTGPGRFRPDISG